MNTNEMIKRLGITAEEWEIFCEYMDMEEPEAYTEDEIEEMYAEYCEIYDIPNEQYYMAYIDYACVDRAGW